MKFDWIETTLGEYSPFVYGKGLPKTKRENGPIPVYGSNGCVDYHKESLVKTAGIIIGRKGSVGEVHLSKSSFWPIDTSFYVVKDSIDELRFVYYLLKTLGLHKMNSDSAVPGLNRDYAHSLKIKIPKNLKVREQIGQRMCIFDDKIELNRQINQTLEAMAQALFKSWFVDFDPVKAKMAAREHWLENEGALPEADSLFYVPYKQALNLAAMQVISGKNAEALAQMATDTPEAYAELQATAQAFPDALVESELGEIPEGWENLILKDILELVYGKALKKTERQPGEFPVYGSGGITGSHTDYLVDGPGIIVGRKGTIGSLYLESKSFYPIDTVFYVKPLEYFSLNYCYFLLQTLGLKNMNTDAAVPGLNRNNAYRLEILAPPKAIHDLFCKHNTPMINTINKNVKEIENLSNLRDTLLPKLLSGELSVDNVE